MCVFKKISFKVSRMYQESLNKVSIAISVHESHRSYRAKGGVVFFQIQISPNYPKEGGGVTFVFQFLGHFFFDGSLIKI